VSVCELGDLPPLAINDGIPACAQRHAGIGWIHDDFALVTTHRV